ncbi:MAG: PD-(D/E)XK nuclease family protein [Victivallaceae bacterium]|nr:PD-(D/E)XK nuclease family protein [Victivallaceae bacterium]
MNIFQVLSQGKSRLHEPSMSAMLGYLLDSNKDHGLGDSVIRKLLQTIDDERFKEIAALGFIDSQVSLEEPYQLNGKRKDIDIQIILLNNDKKECHRIIIENKIKTGAANPKQLNEYYQAILTDEPRIKNLTIVFLTPNVSNRHLSAEFNNLELRNKGHGKYWIHWSSGDNCISKILQELLELEVAGAINPINEYMRHTLKAFIRHSSLTTEPSTQKTMRTGEDIGEILEETEIKTKSGEYRVVRRDSTQIQVFNIETGDKEVARHILAEYIDENNIGILHEKYNTRTIGKKFFEWRKQNLTKSSIGRAKGARR